MSSEISCEVRVRGAGPWKSHGQLDESWDAIALQPHGVAVQMGVEVCSMQLKSDQFVVSFFQPIPPSQLCCFTGWLYYWVQDVLNLGFQIECVKISRHGRTSLHMCIWRCLWWNSLLFPRTMSKAGGILAGAFSGCFLARHSGCKRSTWTYSESCGLANAGLQRENKFADSRWSCHWWMQVSWRLSSCSRSRAPSFEDQIGLHSSCKWFPRSEKDIIIVIVFAKFVCLQPNQIPFASRECIAVS